MAHTDAKRIVVKVGTSTLTHDNGSINFRRIDALCRVLADLRGEGKEIVLVTSAAIGVGVSRLALGKKPTQVALKQAAAAVGQCELMHTYDKMFSEYGSVVAQILLTRDVMDVPERRRNAENTVEALLKMGVIPIVNENDTVAVEEIIFGDNDTLSAMVANLCKADLLILLSDIDGLYDSDPHKNPAARRIPMIHEITDEIEKGATGAGTDRGTGGMATKIHAGKIALEAGFDMVIADGADPAVIYDVLEGKEVGTLFRRK